MGASTTSVTAWAVDLGLRLTLYTDGIFRAIGSGFAPVLDPTTALWMGDGAVSHAMAKAAGDVDANGNPLPLPRRLGDTMSPVTLAALLARADHGAHTDAAAMSLEAMIVKYADEHVPADILDRVYAAYFGEAEEEQVA